MTQLKPDWVLPGGALYGVVDALATTRAGGVSVSPYDAMNLGEHVGDDAQHVAINRARLAAQIGDRQLLWLTQVHGIDVVTARQWHAGICADGTVVSDVRHCAIVMTADCLPVLFSADDGSIVAAVHAGWRGLAAGVLERGLAALGVPSERVLAWIGPAISQAAFEVGDEVRAAFLASGSADGDFFQANTAGRWQADLPGLARHRLRKAGVQRVTCAQACTYTDETRFFSHRRTAPCGRMAAAIWCL